MKDYSLDEIIQLAKEVELEDSIEWGTVSDNQTYHLIGLSVAELYSNWKHSDDKDAIMLATIIKLLAENFILNLKLKEKQNGKETF